MVQIRQCLLVDLDDTLIPDRSARDEAMTATLAAEGSGMELSDVWPTVRHEWRVSGLATVPGLTGVSSWEALWTDFSQAVADPAVRDAAATFQARVWGRLFPSGDAAMADALFKRSRESLVRPFAWAPSALAAWSQEYELWCVTNGSSWLQRRKVALAGLEDAFAAVVTSAEVGAEKADSRFHQAIRTLLARAELVPAAVVGDSHSADGALAAALGVPHHVVLPGEPLVDLS